MRRTSISPDGCRADKLRPQTRKRAFVIPTEALVKVKGVPLWP